MDRLPEFSVVGTFGFAENKTSEVDRDFQVFDGTTFKRDWFAHYLISNGIPWPRLLDPRIMPSTELFNPVTFQQPARTYEYRR